MSITIGVFTGLTLIIATLTTVNERDVGQRDVGHHRFGPWLAVAAGLIAMAVAS